MGRKSIYETNRLVLTCSEGLFNERYLLKRELPSGNLSSGKQYRNLKQVTSLIQQITLDPKFTGDFEVTKEAIRQMINQGEEQLSR